MRQAKTHGGEKVSPIEIVREKEEEIRQYRFESASAIDETGRVILDKPGMAFSIDFTMEEVEHLRAGQNVIFTHNHPRGWEYSAESLLRAGSSFSDTDVEFGCRVELAEIRVVTPMRRYFLRPSASGWSREYWADLLKPVFTRHQAEVKRQFRLHVQRRQISWEEAGAEDIHEIWLRVAAEMDLTYAREAGVKDAFDRNNSGNNFG